jgi:flagellar protein FlaG
MSAETFTTALFLITAVIAAGVLINAIFPIVYQMSGTFSSATHESDQRLRTDFKIITTFANNTHVSQVWMKNIGTQRIAISEIEDSDVFCGEQGDFERLSYFLIPGTPDDRNWNYELSNLNNNIYWDPGETLKITAKTPKIPSTGNVVYFQFVLPNGIWRSNEFTVS